MKYTPKERDDFLRESNAIEGVYSEVMFNDAVCAWEYLVKQDELTNAVVLETHRILMEHSDLRDGEVGQYRRIPVYIGGREAIPAKKIPEAMEGWLAMANVFTHDWKNLHVAYESIHPFVDGNGRTGRMFMNWMRLKFKVPILVLKADDRQEYYKWFK